VPFQLTADILTNVNPMDLPSNNTGWKSPLTDAVQQTTIDIIGFATGLDNIPEYALEMASIPKSMHGLGITCPERIAVLLLLLPLFRTIRYATSGVPLPHTKVHLGEYFKKLYSGWESSEDTLFVIMRHFAKPIAELMHIPAKFSGMSPLVYLVCWHDLASFQHKRTQAAFATSKKSLITNPEPFLGCTGTSEWTRDSMHPTIASDEDIELTMASEHPPAPLWNWTEDITTENVRKGLDSLFGSAVEAYFITAMRSDPAHRLSPHVFRIALARRLRLPVHTYRRLCKCKKWLDIFGDHYFDCHTHYPRRRYIIEYAMGSTTFFATLPCTHQTWKAKKTSITSP
jgi:hypothetical protein